MENKEKQSFSRGPKNQIYIISAVFGIAILFLSFFYILPLIKEIKKNSDEMVSGKNSMFFLGDQVAQVEDFKVKYDSYQADLEKIDNLYVDSKNPAAFFEFLDETAASCSVESEVSLTPENSGAQKTDFMSFQIFSKGSFSKTIEFLEKLETGPYLIEIQKLSINGSAAGVNASLSIKAHISPQ